MPSAIDKQQEEALDVHRLNEACALGLVAIASCEKDPPDVEAVHDGKRIGIEVTRPVEREAIETLDRVHRVLIRRVTPLVAKLGTGQAGFGTHRLRS